MSTISRAFAPSYNLSCFFAIYRLINVEKRLTFINPVKLILLNFSSSLISSTISSNSFSILVLILLSSDCSFGYPSTSCSNSSILVSSC